MSSVMNVDTSHRKQFIIVSAIAATWLLICIIVGATGPDARDKQSFYAYNCPNNSHTWDAASCLGVELSANDTWWIQTLPEFSALNRFWVLNVGIYSLVAQSPDAPLNIAFEVTLLGQNPKVDGDVWYIIVGNETRSETVLCGSTANTQCTSFQLIFEEVIRYPSYQVQITFPNYADRYWIGDVQFEMETGSDAEARFNIGYHVTYFIISIAVFIYYFYKMRKSPPTEWSWEQRALLLLLIGLICFNDIFAPFRYAARGWFFPFMSSLTQVAFSCILLMFWLLMSDKLRREELRIQFDMSHLPKLIVVGIYGILDLILFAWTSISDETDPIQSNSISGQEVLYYIVAIIWVGSIIWVVVLSILTIPVVMRKHYLLNRFLYFAIPTGIVILSILIGIFAGTLGEVGRTTLSFVYFTGLFNTYVYALLWGYWPAREIVGESRSELNEETRLYYNFGNDDQRPL